MMGSADLPKALTALWRSGYARLICVSSYCSDPNLWITRFMYITDCHSGFFMPKYALKNRWMEMLLWHLLWSPQPPLRAVCTQLTPSKNLPREKKWVCMNETESQMEKSEKPLFFSPLCSQGNKPKMSSFKVTGHGCSTGNGCWRTEWLMGREIWLHRLSSSDRTESDREKD